MKRGLIILIIVVIIVIIGIILWGMSFRVPEQSANKNCAKAGEISFNFATKENKDCCEGLKRVSQVPEQNKDNCNQAIINEGLNSICTNCGNNICEAWENKCVCPEDCS